MIKISLDSNTAQSLNWLKKQLRESTDDRVVRKAIALLAQVVEIAGPDRYFLLKTPNGEEIKINLD